MFPEAQPHREDGRFFSELPAYVLTFQDEHGFDLPGSPQAKRQYVGTIEGRRFDEVVLQRDELLSPLPGEKLTLHWREFVSFPSGGGFLSYRERDLVVEGDVPLDDRSGLLEIWFGQFGQSMVMYRDEASCQNMGRKQV